MPQIMLPLRRLAVLVALAAVFAALLVHPSPSLAAASDSALEEAAAEVEAAQEAVHLARAATKDARLHRDLLSERVARNTAARDRSADRLAQSRRALSAARDRVRDARTRLRSVPRTERRAARNHLRTMRARSTARRIEKNTARDEHRADLAAVDRATNGLLRAEAAFTEARAVLDAARVARAEAQQRYDEIASQISGETTVGVANIPNRVSAGGFRRSMTALTSSGPDFLVLNEISGRSPHELRSAAPGYGVYKGGPKLTGPGAGNQSINNAVLWRSDAYEVLAQGRILVVDDDRGYHHRKRFVWDRYATWVTLRRTLDGQVTSVIATHMPTNPEKFPRQHGNPPLTRVQMYAQGMDRLVALAEELGRQGRVLLGGDMNSHPNQGYWSAVAKMRSAGYGYTKDRGVMYLFHPVVLSVQSSRQLNINSDHPALVTTVHSG